MNSTNRFARLALCPLALAAAIAAPAPAAAVTYGLVAKGFTTTMPGGVTVHMWGFATDTGQSCAEAPGWSVGPKLSVDPGDVLHVHLRNCLGEPVSIVIPGQEMPTASGGGAPLAPVDHPSGSPYAGRVRSFTAEAAPGGGAADYYWLELKPGTYVYHSGTHPQVQVQMGLYGAVSKDFAAGAAYDGVSFTTQRDLLFSEIDTALHQAVFNGTYGTTGPTSTLEYRPRYFLVNGQPFQAGSSTCIGGINAGDAVLLRMMNAGLRELAPMMVGSHFSVVAEGGNKYPFSYRQYSVLLPPASSKDVLFTPTRPGTYPIIERRLNLTNWTQTGGGMQTCLAVGGTAVNSPPVASSTSAAANEDEPLPITLSAFDADGDTLVYNVLTLPTNGVLSGSAPALSYTPNANYFGPDAFTFEVNDGQADSNTATVSITVNAVNDAPSFTRGPNQTVTLPAGTQTVPGWATNISPGPANEAGQTVSFLVSNDNSALFSAPGQPAVSSAGTLTYTPSGSSTGSASVTVRAQDSGGTASGGVNTSAPQSFTITVNGAPSSKHVGDLDRTASIVNATTWQAQVTITVHDQNHNPLQGVTVSRSWSPDGSGGGPNNNPSCTTNSAGQCILGRRFSRATTASATFTVTGLTGAGGAYLSSSNHDADSGAQASNGTSITVPRP